MPEPTSPMMRHRSAMTLINGETPAQILRKRILREGTLSSDGSTLRLNAFINHQVDCMLVSALDSNTSKGPLFGRIIPPPTHTCAWTRQMGQCGQSLAHHFKHSGIGITKIVAPRSGVLLGQAIGIHMEVPMVVAVSQRPITSSPDSVVHSTSRPAGGVYEVDQVFHISTEFISAEDRVLVVDDVLASGKTSAALSMLVEQCGATVVACGWALLSSARTETTGSPNAALLAV